ncbi:MAG: hypothetical protein U0230_09080 [Polyangiales bacterium]
MQVIRCVRCKRYAEVRRGDLRVLLVGPHAMRVSEALARRESKADLFDG